MSTDTLRAGGAECFGCHRPLSEAAVQSTGFHKLRSGENIGSTAEFRTLKCACGRRVRLLWRVLLLRRERAA